MANKYQLKWSMANKYRPKWSNDEVLAFFYLNLSEKTAKNLGEALGYEYLGEWSDNNVFRFRTLEGGAKEACELLENRFSELIEWAEPVDLKIDSRCQSLDDVVEMVKNVDWCTTNKDYKKQIEAIVTHLYKVK